jgi:hypothetical protein
MSQILSMFSHAWFSVVILSFVLTLPQESVGVRTAPSQSTVSKDENQPETRVPSQVVNVGGAAQEATSVFVIDSYVVAGGGGSSSGSGFSLDGTIGQAAVEGSPAGGSFALRGGFWNSLPVSVLKKRGGQLTSQ